MASARKFISTGSLIPIATGIGAVAVGILFTFPQNPLVWQAATWTLVLALAGLLVLVLVSGYALVTNRAARTWRSIASFLLGLACLVAAAVGSL